MSDKIKLKELFDKFKLREIRLGPRWAAALTSFEEDDMNAAWELYV